MTSRFDRDTAILDRGDGRFEVHLDEGWWIVDGPNGGYVAAIVARACAAALGDPKRPPAIVTTQFLRRPSAGAAIVETTLERIGRSVATVRARIRQDDDLLVLGTVTLAAARDPVMEFTDLVPPSVSPPDGCEPWPPAGLSMIPLNDRYEVRWAFGERPFSGAPRSESGGWIRTEDEREVDALLLAALADAWVPPVFARASGVGSVAVPTVELSVYVRDPAPRPPGSWVLGVFRSQVATRGFVEEDVQLWDEDGVLLAQSRQLAAIVPVTG